MDGDEQSFVIAAYRDTSAMEALLQKENQPKKPKSGKGKH